MVAMRTHKVNLFMYIVFRYIYTHTQPTNNAIYNTQEKVYHVYNNVKDE